MVDDFSEMMNMMTDNAKFALQKADVFSRRYGSNYVGTEHILLGLLAQDTSLGAKFLADESITLERAEKVLNLTPRELAGAFSMVKALSEAAVLALKMSLNLAKDLNQSYIGTEHILYSLIAQKNSRAVVLLHDMKVDMGKISGELDKFFDRQSEAGLAEKGEGVKGKRLKRRFLSKYGRDLTAAAKNGELDTLIGRDAEVERVVTILCRRTKSNPVLIGEAGVGKTAVVEGLAVRIAEEKVPEMLLGKQIIQVDLAGMISGTKFRGEFEERLKGLIDEVMGDPDVVLFIDELHLLAGAGSAEGSMDAANILKPSLAKGRIRLIGATTFDEYRKHIEKDKALSRRFQTVTIGEPGREAVFQILKGIREHYEKYHDVKIADEVLRDAIDMSERYISDRFMPDKVIDVVDEAAALARVRCGRKEDVELRKLMSEQKRLEGKIEEAAVGEDYEKAALYKTRLAQVEAGVKKLRKKVPKGERELTVEHLAQAISLKTGIPVSKVQAKEVKVLTELEGYLKKYIVGQDAAVEKVARAIRRGRSGVASDRRPIGSFMFMGPTGVGKTELARVIAREVFGGDDALVKIDMSEFSEKHNASRLVGAPAGYVGYDDGGKLTEMVRRRPYCVVLFDEVEKAHPEVFNLLLQILEDGVLTDGQGTRVRFNNTVVILTSNLGAEKMHKESELGFAVKTRRDRMVVEREHEVNEAAAKRELAKMMRPELVNRLDGVMVFRALERKGVEKIFDGLVKELNERLTVKGIRVVVEKGAKRYLIGKGWDAKNGARPLRRVVEDEVEHLVAEGVIQGEYGKGTVLVVEKGKRGLKLEVRGE
ncbi:ATP-dependent Clp protease ATP-binding subunit [Candidatus Saccharibacteria bacterium]|nr:ATP-dependent Clp protease ATP-binding subunit [Candidatus Saccharibacteria bacterium]